MVGDALRELFIHEHCRLVRALGAASEVSPLPSFFCSFARFSRIAKLKRENALPQEASQSFVSLLPVLQGGAS